MPSLVSRFLRSLSYLRHSEDMLDQVVSEIVIDEDKHTGIHQIAMHPGFHPLLLVGMVGHGAVCYNFRTGVKSWATDGEEGVRGVAWWGESRAIIGDANGNLSIMDSSTGTSSFTASIDGALECLESYNHNLLFAGDDVGKVYLWDIRETPSSVKLAHEHSDFISAIQTVPGKHKVLTTAGDGKLGVWDLKKGIKLEALSDDVEEELSCMAMMKNGSKIVCGSQEGVLNLFSWGDFGDVSDRYPCSNDSIDCIVKVDEDRILTAGGDGVIRHVELLPHRLLNVVGKVPGPGGIGAGSVSSMTVSSDSCVLASAGIDAVVRFWDVADLFAGKYQMTKKRAHESENEDSDNGDSSDSDSSEYSGDESLMKRQKSMSAHRFKLTEDRMDANSFFDDL